MPVVLLIFHIPCFRPVADFFIDASHILLDGKRNSTKNTNMRLTSWRFYVIMSITVDWTGGEPLVTVKVYNEVNILAEQNNNQKPVTNPFLVKAIEEMKKERNQQSELAFVNALKPARFIVPAKVNTVQQAVTNADGTVELKEQSQISFLLFNNQEGKKHFPLFTDDAEYAKWDKHAEHQKAAITFQDLCHILQKNPDGEAVGAVINPFSQNVMIPKETLHRINNTDAVAPGTKIQIGTLKEEPTPLLDVLKAYLNTQDVITKAYLRLMKREDKENPNFLLVLEHDPSMTEAEAKAVYDNVAAAAKPQLRNVELAITGTHTKFGQAALKEAFPFFEK